MSYPSVYEHIPWLGWRISHRIKRSVRRWQWLQSSVLKPDCIYLERGCLNDKSLDLDRAFRKTTARLVLDVDDGIFLEQPEKIDHLIAMADHVVVSTETIQEYVSQRHKHITLIPTAVPIERFVPAKPGKESGRCIVGWMGTAPNMPFLGVCAEALRKLAQTREFELLVIGPGPEPLEQIDLTGVKVRFCQWRAESEVQQLQEMDIGLMPLLPGEEWMRYKAATKLVQYMAIGIPAVASPIGVNASILENSEVGFAASSTEEWLNALTQLIDNPDLRKAMGNKGREKAVESYSIEANSQRLMTVLEGSS